MAKNNLQKDQNEVKNINSDMTKGGNLAGCFAVLLIVLMVLLAA